MTTKKLWQWKIFGISLFFCKLRFQKRRTKNFSFRDGINVLQLNSFVLFALLSFVMNFKSSYLTTISCVITIISLQHYNKSCKNIFPSLVRSKRTKMKFFCKVSNGKRDVLQQVETNRNMREKFWIFLKWIRKLNYLLKALLKTAHIVSWKSIKGHKVCRAVHACKGTILIEYFKTVCVYSSVQAKMQNHLTKLRGFTVKQFLGEWLTYRYILHEFTFTLDSWKLLY